MLKLGGRSYRGWHGRSGMEGVIGMDGRSGMVDMDEMDGREGIPCKDTTFL